MIIWGGGGYDDLPINSMTLEQLRTEVWYADF